MKNVITKTDLNRGYKTNERKTKKDFVTAQAKESANLTRQFGQGDKRNWY